DMQFRVIFPQCSAEESDESVECRPAAAATAPLFPTEFATLTWRTAAASTTTAALHRPRGQFRVPWDWRERLGREGRYMSCHPQSATIPAPQTCFDHHLLGDV